MHKKQALLKLNHSPIFFFGLLLSLAIGQPGALAQCDRVGQVLSVTPGCGITLVDVNSGEKLMAVVGVSSLSGGQYFSFESETSALPNGCSSNNLPVVALTCVSDSLPCNAAFSYEANLPGVNQVNFKAIGFSGATGASYDWSFGDGGTASVKEPSHHYAQAGAYEVCLKISNLSGCSDEICKTIVVNGLSNDCGYTPKVTVVGLNLLATLESSDINALPLSNVQWYTNKGTQKLGESQTIKGTLPGYGTYKICVNYETGSAQNGTLCSSSACLDLNVAELDACVFPAIAELGNLCTPLDAPVCGCNGQSYESECEALNAGVLGWWAGSCGTQPSNKCTADMAVEVLSSDVDGKFTVLFTNLAQGNFIFEQLDFGDGSPFYSETQWDTITHVYSKSGIYRANLTVWENETRVSSLVKMVVTDAGSLHSDALPETTDYVLPGDANGDKRANMYDLLNIGVGYYTEGIPRPHANSNWKPQFSPNWEENVAQVNYKHVDCDGDGSINDFDASVILNHYSALDTNKLEYLPGAPRLRVHFDQDTLTIDPQNPPQFLEINASIEIGTAAVPAMGLYGLAFAMQYPEFVNHDPEIFYSNDYWGSLLNMLPISKDVYSRRQIDMGLVRKNKIPANGYGLIGKMTLKSDIIIIIDIVGRAAGDDKIPLVIPIKGVRGIDVNGNVKTISAPVQLDTLWIKLLHPTVHTKDQSTLDAQLQLFPNPCTSNVSIFTGELDAQKIEIRNVLGQLVQQISVKQKVSQLTTDDLESGIYTVRVFCSEGMVEKKLFKK